MLNLNSLKHGITESQYKQLKSLSSFASSCRILDHRDKLYDILKVLMPVHCSFAGTMYPSSDKVDAVLQLAHREQELIIEDRQRRANAASMANKIGSW